MYMRSFVTAPGCAMPDENWAVLNRAFRRYMPEGQGLPVRLDIREDGTAYHLTADLPGTDIADVNLSFEDGTLNISGERKLNREAAGAEWHVTERRAGPFSRHVAFQQPVDAATITARFDKGVLSVTLPKQPQADKAHKIDIQSA